MPKTLLLILITLAPIIVAVGLYLGFGNKFLQKPPVEKVRVGISKSAPELSSLIVIADNQGYFKEERLEVILTDEVNGVIGQQNLLAGKEDIITTSDFGFVRNSFSDASSKIVATIDRASFIDVIVRRDRGISVPSDLKGKKIGFVSKTSLEYFLGRFLTSNNILPGDVKSIDLPFSDIQTAIISGKVDAIVINDPFAYQIKKTLGTNSISWDAQNGQSVLSSVVSIDEFIKSHPQRIERFLKALVSAEQFVKTNSDQAKKIIKDKFQFEQDYFNQVWPKNTFTISLEQSLLMTMEDEARWVIANKLTDKTMVPNYTDFIYADALRKVKLEAVTLY